MNLDYAALISPYPVYIDKVGSIKSPTLKEIWHPNVTYQGYQFYLSLLLMTPQKYYEYSALAKPEWYQSLSEEEQLSLNMFDMIRQSSELQQSYSMMFNFFLEENVIWNNEEHFFFTYKQTDENGETIPVGIISKNIFPKLCDIILQRCGITRADTDMDISEVKSKRALKILQKLKKGRQQCSKTSKYDKDMELPNLISAVAVKSHSINFTNVWELTVYQLYEQFKREQTNVYFDIQKMSVAAYGNEKNSFKGNEWYIRRN